MKMHHCLQLHQRQNQLVGVSTWFLLQTNKTILNCLTMNQFFAFFCCHYYRKEIDGENTEIRNNNGKCL